MKIITTFLITITLLIFLSVVPIYANSLPNNSEIVSTEESQLISESSDSAILTTQQEEPKKDITQPEKPEQRDEILALFSKRLAEEPNIFNFIAFSIQYAVRQGVPANTITLILLLPFLATMTAFIRHIIGLPSIGILVPIALSITFVSTGITAGGILLLTILFGSTLTRITLKKIRIMQLPKMALSILIISILIIITLTISTQFGLMSVKQISFFPILLLILLSERIILVQTERPGRESNIIISITLTIAILGYYLFTSNHIRSLIILYPEILLLLIPINISIGRYFGLRLTEYFRFSSIKHGRK